jgi:hypothetical protein
MGKVLAEVNIPNTAQLLVRVKRYDTMGEDERRAFQARQGSP